MLTASSSDQLTIIPLCNLLSTPENARKVKTDVTSLAASIKALGLLQNLVVVPNEDQPGKYDVAAGERRHQSLDLLCAKGEIPADFGVPCAIKERSYLALASVAENVERAAMNPADEAEAFLKLTAEGMTINAIADAFGCSPLVVERRLAIAEAAPSLLELLREGKIESEQLRALCATSDHTRQVEVWSTSPGKSPAQLRRNAIGQAIDASKDKRVAFIGGLSAYVEAGGEVTRDLFCDDANAGLIENTALLEKLVLDKLETVAEGLRAEGWAWVEVQPEYSNDNWRLGTLNAEPVFTAEDEAKLAEREGEIKSLREQMNEIADDDSEEANERWQEMDERTDTLRDECRAIRDAAKQYTTEAKASAGVIVSLEDDGSLCIERGRVRAEDRKAVAAAGGEINGGRENKSAGRKEGISDALTQSLLAHRNIAAQAELAKHVQVAKIMQAVWAVRTIRGGHDTLPLDLHISSNSWGIRRNAASTKDATVADRAEAFAKIGAALVKDLPKEPAKLFEALSAYTSEQLDTLNAYAFAMSLSLEDNHKGLTGKLLDAISFDMAEHFEATADNFLGRQVPKAMVVKALAEAGKAADKQALLDMKSRDLANEAQKRLAGTGWVPDLIRTPRPKAKAEAAPKTAAPAKGKAKPKAGKKAA